MPSKPPKPLLFAPAGSDDELRLARLGVPPALDARVAGGGPWEVEIGFGKGRWLVERAGAEPDRRFLGIEIATEYYRLLVRRARRRRLANLIAVRGEALYVLSAVLPAAFAEAVHVYFPDPWPKARHHKRRLFDAESVDLVLGLLAPGGTLYFATDFLDYGERVGELLESHPRARLRRVDGPWPGGARTNYEAKYIAEGRPILRFEVTLEEGTAPGEALLHPTGRPGVLAAWAERPAD